MTLQQNRFRSITLLFEVGFYTFFTEMITILRRRVARKSVYRSHWVEVQYNLFHINDRHIETTRRVEHLGRYIERHCHSMTLKLNRVRCITSLFEVGFNKYFTEMITILRGRIAPSILVATWMVKVTTWPCSKIVSGP
jgi:hypothetical protein